MGLRELFVALVALLCLGLGLLLMEQPRTGLAITQLNVAGTPATIMQVAGVQAPVVVIAHGFAGSRQLMHPIQLTLARAGYITVSFDFEGHGRNPQPMRGDVDDIEGTTRLLVDELARVATAAGALPGADGRLAVVGHSMASDIIVRFAIEEPDVDAVVAVSMFSDAVTDAAPANLLVINGQFEGRLRDAAREIMAELDAVEGDVVGAPGGDFARRAIVAPGMEHVGVLYSATTLAETLNWLNESFGRDVSNGLALIGLPVVLTLLGLVVIAQPIARAWPAGRRVNEVPPGAFWTLSIVPAILTPLVLWLVPTTFLPVLVADYLAVHLAIYGALVLGGLVIEGDAPRVKGWRAGLGVALFGILVIGGTLDRYVANFILSGDRWVIFAALLPGAVLAMVADATLLQAAQAPAWRRVVARAAFLLSLMIAVALDPARLFFLVLVLPVMVLYYVVFGLVGGWVGRRSGSALAMGLGLGVILAWALAATFPLFDAQ
ncbi:MAG: alpha/beta fold hydrolase [Pseudomonadota bacterium]